MQFIDLASQQVRIRSRLDRRIANVLDRGAYIMGPEVKELEAALAEFCGAKYALSCANGTDALQLALMALNIAEGDAVFVPSFTFAATAEVLPFVGATPFFVDVRLDTYNLCVNSLDRCLAKAKDMGLRPAAVIPVDLFGLPADYAAIRALCDTHGMGLIADSAQGWGGEYHGKTTGSLGDITTTSFFPAKPLGCYGDGGALFSDEEGLANVLDSLRVHGKGTEKYDNVRIGLNSRLDTLQAAILLEKLAIYADEIEARNQVAARYTNALDGVFITPHVPEGLRSIWAQYTLRVPSSEARDTYMAALKAQGIPTAIYYPKPLHQQTAYCDYPSDPGGLVNSELASNTVFSLPMSAYVTQDDQAKIIKTLLQEI